ncbi:MAG TPA: hypothetical protein VKE98_12625, partial [Gemmataceae bacterium]|nr:hypothetical protein [Gemmataceae bacterium]
KLKNCSARGLNGPAFRLDGDGRALLEVDYSIFSYSDNPSVQGDDPAFIRQTDSAKPLIHYFSKRNCYHNLNVLWALAPAAIIGDPEAFKIEVVKAKGGAETSKDASYFLPAKVSPWAYAEPVDSTLKLFQVRPDLIEVRREREIALGVQKCVWGNMMELPRLDDLKVASDLKEKVVDPDLAEMGQPGYFQTLAQAIALAKPGDVILIKHGKNTREVAVKPAQLDQAKTELTIKPFPGFQPILTFDDETRELNAAFFKLFDGKLRLENLELLLRPAHSRFNSQAVVSLVGNGKCTFKRCLFTLKDVERVPLFAVVLENPALAMKMPKVTRSTPEVSFQDCLVRGDGDLIRIQASRPLDLDLDNSLVALSGSLLSVRSNKETPVDPVNLKLNHVSAFLAEQLVHLGSSPLGKSLAITKVDAKDSLFVALGGKSLVHLDGIDIEEGQLGKVLAWSGNHNAYSGFDMMLDQKRPEENTLLPTIRKDKNSWKDVAGEEEARHVQARFAMKRPLFQAQLDDFRALPEPKVDLQTYGTVLTPDRLPPLAAPGEEKKAEEQAAPENKQ